MFKNKEIKKGNKNMKHKIIVLNKNKMFFNLRLWYYQLKGFKICCIFGAFIELVKVVS